MTLKRHIKFNDLSGKRFNSILVIRRHYPARRKPSGATYVDYECVCDCGHELIISAGSLKRIKHCSVCGHKEGGLKLRTYDIGKKVGSRILIARNDDRSVDVYCELCNKTETFSHIISLNDRCPCESHIAASKTYKEKTGFDNPSQNPEIKQQKRETTFKNYGTEYPSQNPEIQLRQQATCIEKYGVPFASQNAEVALKLAKASNDSAILFHWQTNKEIIVRASYEYSVALYLNQHQIPYDWQIPFKLSNNTTYLCDLYLPNDNKYVEIKGWWRDDAKIKFDLVQTDHPELTFEVWNKEKLNKLGIPIRSVK
jgi:hypothetical protein